MDAVAQKSTEAAEERTPRKQHKHKEKEKAEGRERHHGHSKSTAGVTVATPSGPCPSRDPETPPQSAQQQPSPAPQQPPEAAVPALKLGTATKEPPTDTNRKDSGSGKTRSRRSVSSSPRPAHHKQTQSALEPTQEKDAKSTKHSRSKSHHQPRHKSPTAQPDDRPPRTLSASSGGEDPALHEARKALRKDRKAFEEQKARFEEGKRAFEAQIKTRLAQEGVSRAAFAAEEASARERIAVLGKQEEAARASYETIKSELAAMRAEAHILSLSLAVAHRELTEAKVCAVTAKTGDATTPQTKPRAQSAAPHPVSVVPPDGPIAPAFTKIFEQQEQQQQQQKQGPLTSPKIVVTPPTPVLPPPAAIDESAHAEPQTKKTHRQTPSWEEGGAKWMQDAAEQKRAEEELKRHAQGNAQPTTDLEKRGHKQTPSWEDGGAKWLQEVADQKRQEDERKRQAEERARLENEKRAAEARKRVEEAQKAREEAERRSLAQVHEKNWEKQEAKTEAVRSVPTDLPMPSKEDEAEILRREEARLARVMKTKM